MVALANDDMQMGLAGCLGVANACLENVLRLLDKLAVEIDSILGYPAWCVVLAEDEVGGLFVILGLFLLVAFAWVGRSV